MYTRCWKKNTQTAHNLDWKTNCKTRPKIFMIMVVLFSYSENLDVQDAPKSESLRVPGSFELIHSPALLTEIM